jgi:predicted S18 family serine protease
MEYFSELTAFTAGLLFASILIAPTPTFETAFSGTRTATTNIAAVSSQGNGALGETHAKIGPGDGSTLLNADPFIETDTQASAKTAKIVAQKFTDDTLDNKDITYSFRIDGNYVGGPSAGAAMTLATIAAIENRSVPQDIAVTGTIRSDGSIGRVGGILEKAEAAGQNNLETFYIPEGQEQITYYTQRMDREVIYPGVYTPEVEYVQRTFSVNNYTRSEYNMTTKEVSDIQEFYTDVFE